MVTVVLTPLELELQAFISATKQLGFACREEKIEGIKVFDIPGLKVKCAAGGQGKVQFALTSLFLLEHLKASRLVCIGAAGALDSQLEIGDIVVAARTVEHDYKVKFLKRELPQFAPDMKLFIDATQIEVQGASVHSGIVASGDEDIITAEEAQSLMKRTEAIAVAWEGAGAARAAKFSNVPFLEVRAITDDCSHASIEAFKSNLKPAMANIAKLLAKLFSDAV